MQKGMNTSSYNLRGSHVHFIFEWFLIWKVTAYMYLYYYGLFVEVINDHWLVNTLKLTQ